MHACTYVCVYITYVTVCICTCIIYIQCSAEAVFAGCGALPLFGDALPFLKS